MVRIVKLVKPGVVEIPALLLALASVAAAQSPGPEGTLPPPEVEQTVAAFVGRWTASMTMTMPGHEPAEFESVWSCDPIAGRTAVACSIRAEVPSMGLMEETDLIGYDPDMKTVRLMTWNNLGEIHDHHGMWKDQHTLTLKHSATFGGAPVEETFEFTLPEPNTMRFAFSSTTPEGTMTFTATATRQ